MNNIHQTETEVMAKLIAAAKLNGETAPRAVVVNRVVQNPERSLQRTIRIALIVTSNNETLLDALIEDCLVNDNDYYFVGSDVNFQSSLEVDYLFFEAKVMAKK